MAAWGVKPRFSPPPAPRSWYVAQVEYVILEREFPEPLTPEQVPLLASETQCLDLYRVRPMASYLMPGGRRMVCIFEAPDAQSLRALARANGFPNAVVWSSTLHTP